MSASDVRFRVDFNEVDLPYQVTVGGTLDNFSSYNHWNYYHWMADQINPRSKVTGRRSPGFCQHLKVDKLYYRDNLTWVNGTTTIVEVNPEHWSRIYPEYSGQSPTGSPTDPNDFGYANVTSDFFKTPRFSALCLEAWNKFKTQVPTEVSLLNFIYELKDFKELGKSLSKIPAHVKSGKSTPFVTALRGKGKVRKGAKAVNDSFLSYNFQWAPFVGDIIKFTQLAENVAKRLDFLRRTRGKEVTIRLEKPDCYINSQLNNPEERPWQNADWKRTFTVSKYQCDFIATAKLYQNLEGLDDAWASLKATFAALGINNPAKVVWNAIPFSFLLDWVAPFGTWLERAAAQPFMGTWNVYDCTTSVRERSVIDFHLESRPGRAIVLQRTLLQTVSVDRYTRLVGLPQTLGAFDFSQLTSQQQKLFLSLVLTKVL